MRKIGGNGDRWLDRETMLTMGFVDGQMLREEDGPRNAAAKLRRCSREMRVENAAVHTRQTITKPPFAPGIYFLLVMSKQLCEEVSK
jgi:hypothetical protein